MATKILKIAFMFLIFCSPFSIAIAQQSVNAGGGVAKSASGSVSYSLGQLFYTTSAGASGYVQQGVQQPYEIFEITALENAEEIYLVAYPNPVNDYLVLDVNDFNFSNMHYQILDVQSKILQSRQITDVQTRIEMINLPSAIYFLKVVNNNQEVKVFKIVKN